jgi:3-hydroxyisobutyrate dehydrogenase-like beta-hydroxyacid dehydrogenase
LAGKSEVIKGSETPASFTVAGVAKDLNVFVSVANQAGVDVHAIGAALNSFETHRDAGNGAMDFATMVNAALEQDK